MKLSDKKKLIPLICLPLWLAGGSPAHALTNGFFVPSFRGSASSEYGFWETFTVAVGAPGNAANLGTSGAMLTQTDPSAILTGSSNIYSFSSPTFFTLSDGTPFTLGTVVLQTRSVGSEIDYGQVFLSYTNGFGPQQLSPIYSSELDRSAQPGGTGVSHVWQWDLSSLGVTDYTLTFHAAASSMSFDSMTVDTGNQFTAVPEPSATALAALGLASLLITRARRWKVVSIR